MFVLVGLCAGIFTKSAYYKILSLDDFQTTLYSIGIWEKYIEIVSKCIVFLEILIAICLLAPNQLFRVVGSITGLILTIAFTIFLVYNQYFGNKLDCNCFGNRKSGNFSIDIVRNLGLICVLSIYLFSFQDAASFLENVSLIFGFTLAIVFLNYVYKEEKWNI